MFQSTLPHGERPTAWIMTSLFTSFNPRSHTGSDDEHCRLCTCKAVSIHAPTRGATVTTYLGKKISVFQSTLPHGERLLSIATSLGLYRFQSTLPHGERLQYKILLIKLTKFQSTLPHGERLPCLRLSCSLFVFQSTLPHGERPLIR